MDKREHLLWLGRRVEDKVTGFQGVVTSVSFDLYGCVQYLVNPGLDKDQKPRDLQWFDFGRIQETIEGMRLGRVMEPPADWVVKGPEGKPGFQSQPTGR